MSHSQRKPEDKSSVDRTRKALIAMRDDHLAPTFANKGRPISASSVAALEMAQRALEVKKTPPTIVAESAPESEPKTKDNDSYSYYPISY